MPETVEPSAEDLKLVALARGARARVAAPEGAAVRDDTGRTYAAATVVLPSLHLSALQAAVAQAVAAGARAAEAAALVSDDEHPDTDGLAALRDLGGLGLPVFIAGADGSLHATRHT